MRRLNQFVVWLFCFWSLAWIENSYAQSASDAQSIADILSKEKTTLFQNIFTSNQTQPSTGWKDWIVPDSNKNIWESIAQNLNYISPKDAEKIKNVQEYRKQRKKNWMKPITRKIEQTLIISIRHAEIMKNP